MYKKNSNVITENLRIFDKMLGSKVSRLLFLLLCLFSKLLEEIFLFLKTFLHLIFNFLFHVFQVTAILVCINKYMYILSISKYFLLM